MRRKHKTTRFAEDENNTKIQTAIALSAQAAALQQEKTVAVFHLAWADLGHPRVDEFENVDLFLQTLEREKAAVYEKPFVVRGNESFQKMICLPLMSGDGTDGAGGAF